jgi:hypothetical protein
MHTRVNRIPPALKHGAYSATAVLPGESRAEFEKLHRDLIAELTPFEDDIVADLERLVWRKRIAERARNRRSQIIALLGLNDFKKTEYGAHCGCVVIKPKP